MVLWITKSVNYGLGKHIHLKDLYRLFTQSLGDDVCNYFHMEQMTRVHKFQCFEWIIYMIL